MPRKMKDSGIPWVGPIPEDWEVTRLKYKVATRDDAGEFLAGRDKYIGLENVESNCGGYVETNTEYADAWYDVCKKGDVLYSRLRPYLAKCIIAPFDGFCTGEFLNICSYQGESRYLRYWLTSSIVTGVIDASTYGAKMPRADKRFILNLAYIVPPLPEQKRIADYLDKTVGRIDGLREKISREIERLGDYKKSVISEAVCRGLDKKAKMKYSGIPWVGKIPEGWEVKKIKWLLQEVKSFSETGEELPLSLTANGGVVPFTDKSNKTLESATYVGKKIVKPGQIVFNRFKARLFAVSDHYGLVSPDYAVYSVKEQCDAHYLVYMFGTTGFKVSANMLAIGVGDGFSRLYTSDLFKLVIPVPPLPEQRRIAEYIDKQVARIDALVEKRKEELERLEALKRSIICECVTGKREVA